MGVKDEISSMLESYENLDTSEPEDDVEEVIEKETEEISPATDPPADESDEPDESAATESPSTEAPATEPPDEIDSRLAELERKNAELEEKLKEKTPLTSAPSTDAPIPDQDFIEDEDIDELITDKKSLNKLLNKVFLKGVELTRREAAEAIRKFTKQLPSAVHANLYTIETTRKAAEQFYSDNPDLSSHKPKVRETFDELVNQHPDWTYDKLLKETEVIVRKKHNLKKQPSDGGPPKLPKKKTQQRQTPTRQSDNPVLEEMDQMDKALSGR